MFKKFVLNRGLFTFSALVPFAEMGFTSGMDLYDYLSANDVPDTSSGEPAFFESEEEALKVLSAEKALIYEAASTAGFSIDVELPFLEEWECCEDIHQYDPDAFCTGRVIAASDF